MATRLLRAGTGRAMITPPVGMPMGGWSNALHERSIGNDGDLTATVLMVTDDREAAVLCELDLCLSSRASDAGSLSDTVGRFSAPFCCSVAASANSAAAMSARVEAIGAA